ncbi:uncharacterized protein LOC135399886 [Ornithodoros turicata]|uniref:uncharacterized protein LOC135399886 n=1 Tax=Ornithodoros turicata TaxID=34597 RepID=UPI003138C841
MCGTKKDTLTLIGVACLAINGFNVAFVEFCLRDMFLEHEWYNYVPDVHNISAWVGGIETSDNILLGLAGVSVLFDITLILGCATDNPTLIFVSGVWHSGDCVADAVIGFLSANYTIPSIFKSAEASEKEKKSIWQHEGIQEVQERRHPRDTRQQKRRDKVSR